MQFLLFVTFDKCRYKVLGIDCRVLLPSKPYYA
jgi:hypothetical protein